jgi:mRNA interferase RelE/StbE
MFRILLTPRAAKQFGRLRRFDAATIRQAMERHLRHEPERTSRSGIKRLRGKQDATYRLRVGEFRVFYDVAEGTVTVAAILHKEEAAAFYRKESP